MRPIALATALGLSIISTSHLAASGYRTQQGRCLLVVGEKTYLNGPCPIATNAAGVSSIGMSETKRSRFTASVLDNGDGTFEALWNGIDGASHAQESLGTVKKQGEACWVNSTARICGWSHY